MNFYFYLAVCLIGTSRIGTFFPVVCCIFTVRNCAVSVYVFVARPSDGKFLRGVNKLIVFPICFQSECDGLCDIGREVKAKCIPSTAGYFLIELPYTAVFVLYLIFSNITILICRNSNGISYNDHITLRLCSKFFCCPSYSKCFANCYIRAVLSYIKAERKGGGILRVENNILLSIFFNKSVSCMCAVILSNPFFGFGIINLRNNTVVCDRRINGKVVRVIFYLYT